MKWCDGWVSSAVIQAGGSPQSEADHELAAVMGTWGLLVVLCPLWGFVLAQDEDVRNKKQEVKKRKEENQQIIDLNNSD